MGMVARPYIGIAKGSPCVVPSLDRRMSPPACRSVRPIGVDQYGCYASNMALFSCVSNVSLLCSFGLTACKSQGH